mmetsp:Transcript_18158/g.46481  ORF Transcript_18158/g.46481 Transcript_18158/m.46481 type:complete len:89 (+) Transcript_18158:767-1033(+)
MCTPTPLQECGLLGLLISTELPEVELTGSVSHSLPSNDATSERLKALGCKVCSYRFWEVSECPWMIDLSSDRHPTAPFGLPETTAGSP